jgi:hypothetical protein
MVLDLIAWLVPNAGDGQSNSIPSILESYPIFAEGGLSLFYSDTFLLFCNVLKS